jgi:phosphate transport system substrate-binding protein
MKMNRFGSLYFGWPAIFLQAAIICFLTSCGKKQNNSEPFISFSGAFALYPLSQRWAEEYNKLNPVRFDIQAGGTGKGITDCLGGVVDVGMFSREITDAEIRRGVYAIPLCKDAVLPTISARNPYATLIGKRGISKGEFKLIFTSKKKIYWEDVLGIKNGQRHQITVYTRAEAAGAADSWASYFNATQNDLKGLGVLGDPGVAEAVKNDKYGIGFNNTLFVYDPSTGKKLKGIEVASIDIDSNGKLDPREQIYSSLAVFLDGVRNGVYPSPPVRDLYFITKGKTTDPKLLSFFKWVLNEGQQYVHMAGYVPLPSHTITEQLAKLNN